MRLLLLTLFTLSLLGCSAASTGPKSVCDQLQDKVDALYEAGAMPGSLAQLQMIMGREDLCASALQQLEPQLTALTPVPTEFPTAATVNPMPIEVSAIATAIPAPTPTATTMPTESSAAATVSPIGTATPESSGVRIGVGQAPSIVEGKSLDLGFVQLHSDGAVIDTVLFIVSIDWGDGTETSEVQLGPGVTSLAGMTHIYGDNGVFLIEIAANIGTTEPESESFEIEIANEAPKIEVPRAVSGIVNQPMLLSGQVTDPGLRDIVNVEIDWGDSTGTTALKIEDNSILTASHSYASASGSEQPYLITIHAFDDDGGESIATLYATVDIDSIQVNGGGVFTTNEGEHFLLPPIDFAPRDGATSYSTEVTWGDGGDAEAVEYNSGTFSVSASHRYSEDGIYQGQVRVTTNDGVSGFESFTVIVENLPPEITGIDDLVIQEGEIARTSGISFADAGVTDTHSVVIQWEPGVQTGGQLASDLGQGEVEFEHVYEDDGDWIVRVIVEDDDGGSAEATFRVVVRNASPILDAGLDVVGITDTEVVISASFEDAGTADTHVLSVDWGDGTGFVTNGTRVSQSEEEFKHTYSTSGSYRVVVKAVDDDDGTTTDDLLVRIRDPLIADFVVDQTSGRAPFTVNFTDSSTGNPQSWTWDMGDGTAAVGQNPTHTYFTPGTYSITLFISGEVGEDQRTRQSIITVDQPGWTTLPGISTGRSDFGIARLQDGSVLVVGGRTEDGPTNIVEQFSPQTGQWSSVSPLNIARDHMPATLLEDGKVLVVGGVGPEGEIASAEVFDPSTGSWTLVGSMSAPRYNHTATLLPSGRVLIQGGSLDLEYVEKYLPDTETFLKTIPVSHHKTFPRGRGSTATLMPDGTVLIIGGYSWADCDNSCAKREILAYHETTDEVAVVGTLGGTAVSFHTSTLLPDGTVLVRGGLELDLFNPPAFIGQDGWGDWRPSEHIEMNSTERPDGGRHEHETALLSDGRVLMVGGYGGGAVGDYWHGPYRVSSAIFDPSDNSHLLVGSLNTGRQSFGMVNLLDGRILAVGGKISAGYTNSVEIYTPSIP